jgi:hypothetical protein
MANPVAASVVAVSASGGNWAGPLSTPGLGTAATGMLGVAFAAWNTSGTAWSASALGPAAPAVPASSIADSAGNWWQLAADSGPGCAGARCAVWVSANLLAVDADTGWFSAALQGYAQDFVTSFAVFENLPADYAPVIDAGVAVNNADGSGSVITVTGTTGQADYTFAMACSAAGSAVTSVPPGWSAAYSGTAGMPMSAVYGTAVAGTALSPSWTFGAPGPMAAVIVGISQASYPPEQSNENYPVVKVEAALGATPGDPTQAILDSGWTDLTGRALAADGVAGISVSRGKEYELATPEAGELAVLLNNVDGAFSPLNPGSPYYSNALNSNMAFQAGPDPWTPYLGATVSLSTAYTFASAPAAQALYSLELTCDGVSGYPGVDWNGNNGTGLIPVSVNYEYTFSFWVYSPQGWDSGIFVTWHWFNSSGGSISNGSGSTAAVPAGEWTQVTWTGTPPSGAAFIQPGMELIGTPPATTLFYFAEAGLAQGPAPVQTGMIALETPVRVSAWWQGNRYPVGYGYVERWPQSWPDLPQWGFSPMIATDVVGAANSINLPSALQGEMLADAPYVCLPFGENYSTTENTVNGAQSEATNASGLIAVNTSRVNQVPATYISGGDSIVETGQTMGFEGDSGTGMGVTGYGSVSTATYRGSGAVYGPDTGLPPIGSGPGSSYELWAIIPEVANSASEYLLFPLLQLFGAPYIGSIGVAELSPGWLFTMGCYVPETSGAPSLFNQTSTSTTVELSPAGTLPAGALAHISYAINPDGTFNSYINGVLAGERVEPMLAGNVKAVTFGAGAYAYGSDFDRWNYSAAYGGVYPYRLSLARLTQHYVAGSSGFAGDTIATRFGRYLTWGFAALNPAGPGSVADAFELSAAYGTSGSSIASALNADCTSSGSSWLANAAGNLVILPRPAGYNVTPLVTFGDNPANGEIPYQSGLQLDYDNTYLQNAVQASLVQGENTLIAPIQKDQASIAQYFQRGPLAIQVNGQTSQDAYDAVYWNLGKYSQPQLRTEAVTVDAASHPDAFTAVLSTDIADTAVLIRRPVGAPPYQMNVITEQVKHQIGPGIWETSYQLSPYVQEGEVLTADLAGHNILGDSVLGW